MLVISVRERGKDEHPFTFDKNEVVIGRLQENDICLRKKNISKRHSVIRVTKDGVFIADAGSTNGTFINGKRITEASLVKDDDRVVLGDYILKIKVEAKTSAVEGKLPPLPADPLGAADLEQGKKTTVIMREVSVEDPLLQARGTAPEMPKVEPIPMPPPVPPREPESTLRMSKADLDLGAGDEELFEIPLEEEMPAPKLPTPPPVPPAPPAPPAHTALSFDEPIESMGAAPHVHAEPASESTGAVDVLGALLDSPDITSALVLNSGVVMIPGSDGQLEDSGLRFPDIEDLMDMLADFSGLDSGGSSGSRVYPERRLALDVVVPPLATAGIHLRFRRMAKSRNPVTELVKQGIVNAEQAREFVRSLTLGRPMLLLASDPDALEPLVAAAMYHISGKPRVLVLGAAAPLRSRDARERVDLSMQEAVADSDELAAVIETMGADWVFMPQTTLANLAAVLPVLTLAQVPFVAACRLMDGADPLALLRLADELTSDPVGEQALVTMMQQLNPVVLRTKQESDGKMSVSGLYDFKVGEAGLELVERK
jgi:hypothetical protein